ncbi:MAG: hypothetical protein ABMA14_02250 [Hyphomonadaceae bacterium]
MGRQLGALALLALLVRAIVPAGYMLASAETAEGRYLVVQLCDSHAGFSQIIDLDTGKQVDATKLPAKQTDKSSKAPCVFAAAPHLSAPETFVGIVAPVVIVRATGFYSTAVAPGRGIAAPPPPSTGPPSLI